MSTARTLVSVRFDFRTGLPRGPYSSLTLSFLIFAISILAFLGDYVFGARVPQLGVILSITSFVTCGLSWLLSRALFRPGSRSEIWPKLIVAILFLTCLVGYVTGATEAGGVLGYIGTLHMVIGSAMLFMIPVEALDGLDISAGEKRFRLVFAAGYIGIVGVSFAFRLPELQAWQEGGCAALAAIALVGASMAVLYRQRNPLAEAPRARSSRTSEVVEKNPVLAARLQALLDVDRVFLNPDIKVGEIANHLRQPEYRISQCIVQDLGFSNFSQMINTHRIAEAKERLSHPDFLDCSILVIAMDCGFGSIGPFNRAFKADTGMTPREFRREALRLSHVAG